MDSKRNPVSGTMRGFSFMGHRKSGIARVLHRRCALMSLVILAVLFMAAGSACAGPPAPNGAAEVESLLSLIGTCGCQFYRNGTWYSGPDAQAHLKKKYNYLHEQGMAGTAEEFITNVAAKSSVSGELYQIQCGSQPPMPSAQWLRIELQRLRAQPGTRAKP